MKTLKKSTGKTVEYSRVKDEEVKDKLANGFKFCGKVECKTATKGYGRVEKKAEPVKVEEDVTAGIPKKRYNKLSRS